MDLPFRSPYSHGFARVAAAVPHVRIGDPGFNAQRTVELAQRAGGQGAALVVFPELGLAAYSSEDLFHQAALLDGVETALERVVRESAELAPVIVVGAPVRAEGGLFNAAVVVHRGRILGAVPKSFVPEYREYYEKRQFRAARDLIGGRLTVAGETVPFGADLLFDCEDLAGLTLHVEICEDLWTPIPPSTYGALAGATVLANLSASNITIGKDSYRRMLCEAQSGRAIAGYVYTAAGLGESTTDMAWDGQALIYENGQLLAESERFSDDEELIVADLDLDRIESDRMTTSSYGDSIHDDRERLAAMRRVPFVFGVAGEAATAGELKRRVERFPYVPADPVSRNERCEEVYNIQVRGLETRLSATGIQKVVIGVSGGLDSTHALIVAVRAIDRLGLPRSNVLGYTMPGFATSARTLRNAHALMKALGVSAEELDIRPSAMQMLRDLGHPAAEDKPQYDVTFENVQAGERTSHLFRLANHHGGLVLGTGDLSELALGWSTYGVGDQMSHYSVNALGAQDADPLPAALGDRHRSARRRSARGAALDPRDRDLARADPGDRRRRGARAGQRGDRRPIRAPGFLPLLRAPVRLSTIEGRLPGRARVGRSRAGRVAGPDPGRAAQRVHAERDPTLARSVPAAVLRDQPVQALSHAQRPQGGVGWVAVAALGLAGAERRQGDGLAGRARSSGPARALNPAPRHPCYGRMVLTLTTGGRACGVRMARAPAGGTVTSGIASASGERVEAFRRRQPWRSSNERATRRRGRQGAS